MKLLLVVIAFSLIGCGVTIDEKRKTERDFAAKAYALHLRGEFISCSHPRGAGNRSQCFVMVGTCSQIIYCTSGNCILGEKNCKGKTL